MTHESDFTYLDRCVCNLAVTVWVLYRIFSSSAGISGFIPFRRLLNGDLKPIITLLLTFSLILVITSDALATLVKYQEGFINVNTIVISKPKTMWQPINLKLSKIADSLLNFSFAFLTSSLFLLHSFWHFMVKTLTRMSFMSSLEFRLYLVYSFLSLALYPTLQFWYLHDTAKATVIPQFAFCAEGCFIVISAAFNHVRLRTVLREISTASRSPSHVSQFLQTNLWLGLSLTLMWVSLLIVNVEFIGFVGNPSKFTSDLLLKLFNLGYPLTFMNMYSILLPAGQDYPQVGIESFDLGLKPMTVSFV
ncbi:hypothetical protein K7432_006340 [Basidiobolus ranarum]|uniref:Gustatory receptor n=1 Tax=Basidiobolus ranarum TaxID=34480 RepID=A0ABR2WVA3_9FUNG